MIQNKCEKVETDTADFFKLVSKYQEVATELVLEMNKSKNSSNHLRPEKFWGNCGKITLKSQQ